MHKVHARRLSVRAALLLFAASAAWAAIGCAATESSRRIETSTVQARNTPYNGSRATGVDLRQKAQARVKPAEDVLARLEQRDQGNEPFTTSLIERRAGAQRQLAEARIDATDDSAARVRAAEQYVQQARHMLAILEARQKAGAEVTPVQVAHGAYAVADAEYLLAKLQSAGATGADVRQQAHARVKPAQDVLAGLEQRVQADEPLTPSFIELWGRSQRLLAEARIDATDDSAARVRAGEQYVQQSRDTLAQLEARRKAGADVTAVQVALGTYAVADAEYLLAQLAGGTGADLRQKAQAKLKPAEDVLAGLEQRVQANEPLTPSFLQVRARWQRRLAEARIDATGDSAARVRAADQYVQQSRHTLAQLEAREKAGADVTLVEVSQGAYEVADAEYLLAKMQGS